MADTLSVARILLALAVAWCGAAGQGRLALFAVVTAAITDVFDGRIARRRGASRFGPRLDAFADAALLTATAGALVMLHPAVLRDRWALLLIAAAFYGAGTTATWLATRRFVDPDQLTAKLAGAALYAFALFTLATGVYEPVLLAIAAGTLVVACLDAILRAIPTIHASWMANRQRSHAPHAEKLVVSNGAPMTSMATARTPSTTRVRP